MLDQVRARRQADAPANDVYYYGMVKPTATFAEYCGAEPSCTAGLGYLVSDATSAQAPLRAAVGLAFADSESVETMLHELGHNHGRRHAPCGVTDTTSVDASFPHFRGEIGVSGWDQRSLALVRSSTADLMGYCRPRWMSAYTYDGVMTRAAGVSGAAGALAMVRAGPVSAWRVLLSDARGERWGVRFPEPTVAYGAAETALILDASGRTLETVQVYRMAIPDLNGASFLVPEPKPGWYGVQVAGAGPLPFLRGTQ
jgi:hypothetical protein